MGKSHPTWVAKPLFFDQLQGDEAGVGICRAPGVLSGITGSQLCMCTIGGRIIAEVYVRFTDGEGLKVVAKVLGCLLRSGWSLTRQQHWCQSRASYGLPCNFLRGGLAAKKLHGRFEDFLCCVQGQEQTSGHSLRAGGLGDFSTVPLRPETLQEVWRNDGSNSTGKTMSSLFQPVRPGQRSMQLTRVAAHADLEKLTAVQHSGASPGRASPYEPCPSCRTI